MVIVIINIVVRVWKLLREYSIHCKVPPIQDGERVSISWSSDPLYYLVAVILELPPVPGESVDQAHS